ncbi:DUF1569 domain-containing protein [Planctobacterium marinum]|uniref:DUF1569 domain-containing protein n=1 Tax=Planctobacterium marinum TaxID=1631968 RepID=UPI001E5B18C6|nr:DUF1569 domain-containing protein [Planctobacterium marinum]MCC2608161.1 DUF1569 domain-containing protein [Planctobacterium marinum]
MRKWAFLVKLSVKGNNLSAMNRRFFIASSLSLGLLGVSGVTAWHMVPRNKDDLSLTALIKELEALKVSELNFDSNWSVGHKLAHLAQSVEYSMSGYPVHKSEMFKSTVGKAAFSAFSSKGYMKHNLEEDIPGAPSVDNVSAEQGQHRLLTALQQFDRYRGELAEHFAYGALTHEQYALAHVLHVKDHFSLLV